MTDQDNLRDRIKEVLDRVDDAAEARDTGMGVATTAEFAQAIIDELGLTVETRNDGCIACGEPPESRVVGKWERQ